MESTTSSVVACRVKDGGGGGREFTMVSHCNGGKDLDLDDLDLRRR